MLPVTHVSGTAFIIEDMCSGGTTAGILTWINHQESMNRYHPFIDESSIADLNALLGSTTRRRHFQRKEAGIRVALFYYDFTGEKHILVLFGDRKYNYYSIVDFSYKTRVYVENKCRLQEEKDKLERIIMVIENATMDQP